MTYRDVLAHIDEKPGGRSRATFAAELARRFSADLTGVFLESSLLDNYASVESFAYMPPEQIDRLVKEHADAVLQASEEARLAFEATAAAAALNSEWLTLPGERSEPMIKLARHFDLTIFPASATPAYGIHRLSAAALALASCGPVLVPREDVKATVGRRVLVAWKGTRESARALRDAWPLIAAAEDVRVLKVSPHGDDGPEHLLQRHFERHGRPVEVIVDRSDDLAASDVIRRHVAALDADLLVMGIYGRPRLQEFILGGVSEEILSDPPTSLLLAH
ncbi:MAG: universal stress protein [Phenylobacterium sp.]|uniref:universal stress protein n=1 Tax=Phenylobacterium sp. TaxID=1871053 RepID=UPI002728F8CE|nr:universal stress protein [Phenylobacterium sp.]MDO8411835.1 universal stress protein [Phenylobacterium sp.]